MAGKSDDNLPDESKRTRPLRRRRGITPLPTLMGAVDVGSTAMRLNIAEYLPDHPLRFLEELTHPIAIGADTFRHGRILPETLFSICGIMDNFVRVMNDYGVKHRRAVTSSAVREAANRDILVDRVKHSSGLDLEILDAIEESRIIYQALLPWLRQHPTSYSLALNLGGASSEIMILRGEDLLTGDSRRIGTSRQIHALGRGGNQSRAERLQTLTANIIRYTRETYQEYNIDQFFLVNRLLYRAFHNLPEAVRRDNSFVIGSVALRERILNSSRRSPLEIGADYNLGLAEVEMLVPAMLILNGFVEAAEVEEVTFTDTETLDGLMHEMVLDLEGVNPLMAFRRQIVRSARAVGEQYYYDRIHARLVTEFSLILFDAMRELLDLGDKDRLLLELSGVLHDIGMYVNEHHHQHHSAYLVKWSNIVGLNENDRKLTAQIVYFHRRDLPGKDFPEFMALTRDERMRVGKLAGLLRLADVLDRGHHQSVKGLRAEISGEKLFLYLTIAGDMGIILDELPKKADLLEQVSGLQVVLRRELPRPD